MSEKRYLTLNEYNGALTGLLSNPAGAMDSPSPGGLSSIDHHWTHGLFGYGDRVLDAYEGTGDRYIYGPYGNLYTPNAHASIYDDYRGPSTSQTQNVDLHGDPYFWTQGGPATNKGQELVHHAATKPNIPNSPTHIGSNHSGFNMHVSKGRPIVPREGVGFVPSNIEHFEHGNAKSGISATGDVSTETSIEFIDDPVPIATTAPLQREFSQQKPQKPAARPLPKPHQNPKAPQPKTCNRPPPQNSTYSSSSGIPPPTPDSQKTTEIKLESGDDGKHKDQKNKTTLILVLIGVLVCIDLWGEFTHVFIAQYLNKGVSASWMKYATYAIIATITIIVVIQQTGVKVPVCA
jgi:hypothetical protein